MVYCCKHQQWQVFNNENFELKFNSTYMFLLVGRVKLTAFVQQFSVIIQYLPTYKDKKIIESTIDNNTQKVF